MKLIRFLIVSSVFLMCIYFTLKIYWDQFHYFGLSNIHANWGTFGDYVGGVLGTIFGLISVIFLYYTFQEQRKTSIREKFENKYYELIKLHRDNVAEIGIGNDFGRKVFILIIREFREILPFIKKLNIQLNLKLNPKQIIEVSYITLFYGTGPNSTRVLKKALNSYKIHFLDELINELEKYKEAVKIKRTFKYTPFEGHQSRLGHYFRHFYQTIKFVDNQSFLSFNDKKDYVKTIRAQLSNHEQALLFLNSISKLGRPWELEDLITKYSLIKNLPESFFDGQEEINIKDVYPDIIFEWQEVEIIAKPIVNRKATFFWNKFELRIIRYEKK